MADTAEKPDCSDLTAVFINCTLTPSPEDSHTDTLMDVVREIMSGAGVSIKSFRSVDHDIAPGVYVDMTEQGFASDAKDDGSRVGFDGEFTARNSTFLAWNLMHIANMLKQSGGLPAYGNSRRAWNDGARFDHPNPEYR